MKTIAFREVVPVILAGVLLFAGIGVSRVATAQEGAGDVASAEGESTANAPIESNDSADASSSESSEPSGTTSSDKPTETREPDVLADAESEVEGDAADLEEVTGVSGYLVALIAIGLVVIPVLLGNFLSRSLRMPDHGWKISVVTATIATAAVVLLFGIFNDGLRGGPDLVGGINLVYELEDASELVDPATGAPKPKDDEDGEKRGFDMDDMIAALIRRVNPGGNKEVTIRKYGGDQIEIIIPSAGEDELARIKDEITTLGELEFRITADRGHPEDLPVIEAALELSPFEKDVEVNGVRARWIAYSEDEFGPVDAPDPRIVKRIGKDRANQDVAEALILIDPYDVTGKYLFQARVGADNAGRPAVLFRFNSVGAQRFSRLTGNNLPDPTTKMKRNLGIVLNRTLERAPGINSKISADGIIEGYDNQAEVEKIVNILNAGSLPAALNPNPISEETISPTLGLETIEKGKFAIGLSLALVLVFMVFYYRFAGFVACLALAVNLLLILGVMVLVKAAFTLPGLAGLVLTVGMSVDANVLIFERIREELAHGAAMRMAIRNGFGRATRTIVDANLTTLITGVVLFWIGTDQIKGFAITLILGIVMSMYTAIFCSRLIFDIAERRRWISEIKMRRLIGDTQFNFLSKKRIFGVISCVLILVGLIAAFSRSAGLFDIDFTGGASVTMVLKDSDAMTQGDVRRRLADTELGTRNLSVVQRGEDGTRFTINARFHEADQGATDGPNAVEQVQAIIRKAFGDSLATQHVDIAPPRKIAGLSAREHTVTSSHGKRKLIREPEQVVPSHNEVEEDAIVMAYDPTGRTQSQISFLQDEGQEDVTAEEGDADTVADSAPSPDAEFDSPDAETTSSGATETSVNDSNESSEEADSMPNAERNRRRVFEGGTETTLTFDEPVSYETVVQWITEMLDAKYPGREISFLLTNPLHKIGSGSDVRLSEWNVRLDLPIDEATPLLEDLKTRLDSEPLFPMSNLIGGRVADKMQQLAALSIIFSLVCIVGYIWLRFQHVVFGLAAVVALVHDVLVTLGMIAVSAYLVNFAYPVANVLQLEAFQISLPIVAAFLTIIGYSLNDTIVVFDRIREVRGKSPEITEDMINSSINQTLGRTILTSLTTLIVVAILYFFGGAGIHGFAFALVVGVIVGTYSSIFIASPILLWLSKPKAPSKADA